MLSRRLIEDPFLHRKLILAGAVGLGLLSAAPSLLPTSLRPSTPQAPVDRAYYEIRSAPTTKVEVRVRSTDFEDGARSGRGVRSPHQREELLRQVLALLPRYDPVLRAAYRPGFSVEVARDLHSDGRSVGGYFLPYEQPSVVLDADDRFDWTLPHELYHALDSAQGFLFSDPTRVALNPSGSDAYLRRGSGPTWVPAEPPGFARGYGKTKPCEDKATVFEALATDAQHLRSRLPGDPVLARKVALLSRRLPRDFVPPAVTETAPRWPESDQPDLPGAASPTPYPPDGCILRPNPADRAPASTNGQQPRAYTRVGLRTADFSSPLSSSAPSVPPDTGPYPGESAGQSETHTGPAAEWSSLRLRASLERSEAQDNKLHTRPAPFCRRVCSQAAPSVPAVPAVPRRRRVDGSRSEGRHACSACWHLRTRQL